MSAATHGSVKRTGRHFTPPALAAFLAERAAPYLPADRPLRVLDPACGDGELLVAAHAALTARGLTVAETAGCELDPAAAERARRRLAALPGKGTMRAGDFLELAAEYHRFHLIITNPPYVRTQVLGADVASALADRFGLAGRVDLTHPFVTVAARLLHPGGVLALLCSNRFLSTRAGANVRRVLDADFSLREIYDLGDTRLFTASVLPAVVIAVRAPDRTDAPPPRFTRVYETARRAEPAAGTGDAVPSRGPLLAEIARGGDRLVRTDSGRSYSIEVGTLVKDGDGPWTLRTEENARWLARLRAGTWRTFGEVARTRVGIKTTADAVFVRDDWESLPPRIRPEDELLLPLLTHETVTPWRVAPGPRTRVLYPYDLHHERRRLLDMDRFPRAMAYLRAHEDRLRGRTYVTRAGRSWFEIWVPQRPALWRPPKIVFPDISEEARFALDTTGAVVNGDCYWISFAGLPSPDVGYLMLAVANSRLGVRFYDTVCGNRLYARRRRWITQYVDRLPLPDPASPASRRAIALARDLCAAADVADSAEAARAHIDAALEDAFR